MQAYKYTALCLLEVVYIWMPWRLEGSLLLNKFLSTFWSCVLCHWKQSLDSQWLLVVSRHLDSIFFSCLEKGKSRSWRIYLQWIKGETGLVGCLCSPASGTLGITTKVDSSLADWLLRTAALLFVSKSQAFGTNPSDRLVQRVALATSFVTLYESTCFAVVVTLRRHSG